MTKFKSITISSSAEPGPLDMVPAQNLLRAEPEANFRLRRRRRIAHMAQILLLARRVVTPGETERK